LTVERERKRERKKERKREREGANHRKWTEILLSNQA